MSKHIETSFEEFTPKQARDILENHLWPHNRNLSRVYVRKLVSDMRSKRFATTHQGIAFNDQNKLVDGQHRLAAVVEYGKPVTFMVTRGLPSKQNGVHVMDALDMGRPRSIGTQLQIQHGIKNHNTMAACANAVIQMCTGLTSRAAGVTVGFVLDVLNQMEPEFQWLAHHAPMRKRRATMIGPLGWYMKFKPRKGKELADAFFNLRDVEPGHPAIALNRWLENVRKGKGNDSSRDRAMRVMSSAIQRFDEGEHVEVIKPSWESVEWLANRIPSLRRQICSWANVRVDEGGN